jgi:hypothetical protein
MVQYPHRFQIITAVFETRGAVIQEEKREGYVCPLPSSMGIPSCHGITNTGTKPHPIPPMNLLLEASIGTTTRVLSH